MKQENLLKYGIWGLILLNIGLLSYIFLDRRKHHRRDFSPPWLIFSERIGFDSQQQTTFDSLRTIHMNSLDSLRKASVPLRTRLFGLLDSAALDTTKFVSLMDSITQNRREQELRTFEHFRDVRAICRPDQMDKFRDAMRDVSKFMSSPPHHKGRGGKDNDRDKDDDNPPPPPPMMH